MTTTKQLTAEGFRVTRRIDRAHPTNTEYPLLPGDLLVRDAAGRWTKEAPGLAVNGFELTVDQVASLEPIRFVRCGLTYEVVS